MKGKYPRFFVPIEKGIENMGYWTFNFDVLYIRINGMYQEVIAIDPQKKSHNTPYTERGCDDFIKKGWWKEIKEEEAALL